MNKFRMRHAITLALNEEGTQEWDVHKRSAGRFCVVSFSFAENSRGPHYPREWNPANAPAEILNAPCRVS